MPRARTRRPVNPRLGALVTAAIADAQSNIEEVGQRTGLGRGVIGRIARGQIHRLAPDQANRLVPHLPITMEELLEACGYNVGVTPAHRLPPALVAAWPSLPPPIQQAIVSLASWVAIPKEDPAA